MADSTTTTRQIVYELSMQNENGDTAKRSISFDTEREWGISLRNDAESVAASLAGAYKWAIQPNNWRDSDVTESAYETINVETQIVQKTVMKLNVN